MKIIGARLVTVAGLVGAAGLFVNTNCGSGNGTGAGGGSGGHGGAFAGNGGHGGTAGGGGGSAGAAGGSAGGVAGAGGSAGAGGQAGSPTDGGSNTDGGSTAAFAYDFNSSTEGFILNKVSGAGNLANIEGGAPPSLTWDSSVGNPTPGSLKVDATFTDYGQFVLAAIDIRPTIDATGKTAQAWVMLDPVDGGAAFSGGAILGVSSTGGNEGAAGAYTVLTPGVWKLLTLDLASQAAPFDPAQVIQISIQILDPPVSDGGSFAGPVHATFHIDSITDGSGGAPPPPLSSTFDTTDQGYVIFSSSIVTPDGGAAPSLRWDSAVGYPAPGSLELNAEFTGYDQGVNVQSDVSPGADLTGKVIHAKVRLDSGTLPTGYALLHASSGPNYVYFQPVSGVSLIAGSWVDLSLDLAAAKTALPSFDPSQIVQVGVWISTGDPPDGGEFPTPAPLAFHIDSIVAQ